ncbi:tetratricopeptide repeat protein [Devosia aquimaris]|uniref:tetratricopeptide repeat protein n=1 Tax=Devosia aquimaris TaxID=2866214 RepID=UPI001CD12141|nr:tetratricopeptide repeat protein [Devosia sp. CJK-A8-3]
MLSRLACGSAALLLAATIHAAPVLADDPVAVCDALASSPLDTARPADVVGVAFEEIDIAAAEPACRAAWEATADPRIGYQLARVLFQDQKLEEANALFGEAAAAGHVEAKVGMAQTLLELARAHAAALLKEAADAGSLNAMYNLALDYAEGDGVPQDTGMAIALYEQASARGDAWSSYNLGVLYDEGSLVLRDAAKAKQYYEQAIAKDHYWAMINLGYLLLEGEVDAEVRDRAVALFRRATTEDGDINAGLQLGILLQDGNSAEQDESEQLVIAALKARDTELGSFLQQPESGLSPRNLAAIKAEIGIPAAAGTMGEADIAQLRRYYAQTP